MKVWITKYALSHGIIEKEAELCTDSNDRMISTGDTWNGLFHKPHWHTTQAEAVARAEHMRTAKIAALKKQIRKLEALKFT